MTATPRHNKLLLVEGQDDLYAIAKFMGKHIAWPKDIPPVKIEAVGSAGELLLDVTIPLRLKSSEVQILGVIVDSDDVHLKRWNRLHQLVKPSFPHIPDHLPSGGAVVSNTAGKRILILLMPYNKSFCMLETFMKDLIPPEKSRLWKYAVKAAKASRKIGAPFTAHHLDKACIHTWLAWQEPPGERFGTAILQNILNAHSNNPCTGQFVAWFRKLYDV